MFMYPFAARALTKVLICHFANIFNSLMNCKLHFAALIFSPHNRARTRFLLYYLQYLLRST